MRYSPKVPIIPLMKQPSQTSRWIFVFEPDNDARAALKDNLRTWGYAVVMALDQADAIERVQQSPQCFDLILLNQCDISIADCLALGNQIRQAANFDSHIPILILAEQYGEEQEGQDVQLGDHEYLSYLQDGEQLKRILQRLCPV